MNLSERLWQINIWDNKNFSHILAAGNTLRDIAQNYSILWAKNWNCMVWYKNWHTSYVLIPFQTVMLVYPDRWQGILLKLEWECYLTYDTWHMWALLDESHELSHRLNSKTYLCIANDLNTVGRVTELPLEGRYFAHSASLTRAAPQPLPLFGYAFARR